MTMIAEAIFQLPPFPDAVGSNLVSAGYGSGDDADAALLLAAMRNRRVGGKYWLAGEAPESDPWSRRDAVKTYSSEDPCAFLDAIVGRPVQVQGEGFFSRLSNLPPSEPETETVIRDLICRHLLSGVTYHSPFTGEPIDVLQLVDILGDWRDLIDSNRPIMAAFGFAPWKQETICPLLWGGHTVRFLPARNSNLSELPETASIAVWKARVPAPFLEKLESGPWRIIEVEDGFIRSAGLGADCVPPLSIVVDDLGVHYDPTRPNRLEETLVRATFAPTDLDRAAALRHWLVRENVSKYGVATGRVLERFDENRRHLLVVGQVEDDRSVQFGGGEIQSNLELLRRVRDSAPDAYIIYRPHPDVEAGHRRGAIPQRIALEYADFVDPGNGIGALIDLVDEVHVITSLAGFEALMRGKAVTTHGTPFFAGWGLTHDLAPVPSRRGVRRSLDELVAATLLQHPRYLDPVTNLPCPPEVMILRLLTGNRRRNDALVPLRQFFGWMKRASQRLLDKR
ncbi:MAG: hypothetical protein J7485_04435 [Sphingobium sp.]|nr:hypothetical protein [Sphingobium sp.]